jgi:hypothetical protein
LAIMLPALQAAGTKAHPRFWLLRRAAANLEVAGQALRHEALTWPAALAQGGWSDGLLR